MKAEDLAAELEADFAWRLDELRRLRNHLYKAEDSSEVLSFRKALLVMLYAHFEGFFKTGATAYVKAINLEALTCAEATLQIAASALTNEFEAFETLDRKNRIFRALLPEDRKLHRYCRRVDLLAALDDFLGRSASVPVEDVVDLEANLKPSVIRKLLFQIGLPYDSLAGKDGYVHRLLEYRNDVAHGTRKEGFEAKEYSEIESAILELMQDFKALLLKAFADRVFARAAAA